MGEINDHRHLLKKGLSFSLQELSLEIDKLETNMQCVSIQIHDALLTCSFEIKMLI